MTITLNGQQVYQRTSSGASLSLARDTFQEEEDAVRETGYMVAVEAVNIAGTGGQATATFTVPSGKSKDLISIHNFISRFLQVFREQSVI